ncbi:MAG: BadF/BadG/BcrA/BcrD ATPase family protein [Sphingomonadales bacterium]
MIPVVLSLAAKAIQGPGEGAMDAKHVLGIDAGGSHCRARLVDAAGAVLGEGRAGPANFRLGAETAQDAVLAASHQALAAAGLDETIWPGTAVGLGMAGIERRGARAALMARSWPFARLALASDAEIAHWGAHQGGAGGTLIVGTGSVAIMTLAQRSRRWGGYGFPASDQGSAADLGLAALRHALLAHDGLAALDGLAAAVLDRFGGEIAAIIAFQDQASATDYAALAPLVTAQAQAGDAGARAIMQAAAEALARMLEAMAQAGAERLVLLGGLGVSIKPWLAQACGAALAEPLGDALAGALMLARGAAPPALAEPA